MPDASSTNVMYYVVLYEVVYGCFSFFMLTILPVYRICNVIIYLFLSFRSFHSNPFHCYFQIPIAVTLMLITTAHYLSHCVKRFQCGFRPCSMYAPSGRINSNRYLFQTQTPSRSSKWCGIELNCPVI